MLDWTQFIERSPQVMLGKPVFKGTRITVEFVLERLMRGATERELVDNYPGLLPDHIPAALDYAKWAEQHEK